MASAHRVPVDMEILRRLYVDEKKSIPLIQVETGVSRSTIRARLLELGVLRGRGEAIRLAGAQGRMSSMAGVKRDITPEWREKINQSLRISGAARAKGVTVKPSGYVEYTRGEHKGRSVHVVKMEEFIGRRLAPNEEVHHRDHNRGNNKLSNLQLLTKSEHAALHARENHINRKRGPNGQFE